MVPAAQEQHQAAVDLISRLGFDNPTAVSSITGEGMEALQRLIRERLFGRSVTVQVFPPTLAVPDASERIVSAIYDHGMVESDRRSEDGLMTLEVWMASSAQARLLARWKERIDIK